VTFTIFDKKNYFDNFAIFSIFVQIFYIANFTKQNIILGKNFLFLTKFLVFDKIFDSWQNFWFCANFRFLLKLPYGMPFFRILTTIFDFWQKFQFLAKFSIVGEFLAKFSISGQGFHFWPNFLFLAKFSIFGPIFHFWPTLCCSVKFLISNKQFESHILPWLNTSGIPQIF